MLVLVHVIHYKSFLLLVTLVPSGSLSAATGCSYLGDRVGIGCNHFPTEALSLPDGCKIGLGTDDDFSIYHDGGK